MDREYKNKSKREHARMNIIEASKLERYIMIIQAFISSYDIILIDILIKKILSYILLFVHN